MSTAQVYGCRWPIEALSTVIDPAYAEKQESDSAGSLRVTLIEESAANNTAMKSAAVSNPGKSGGVYETTIFDFENRTISTQYTGGYKAMDSGPAAGTYNRNNPICEAAFSVQSSTYYSGCLEDVVNNLSNACQKQLELLESALSGEELARESEDLNAFFAQCRQVISDSFSQMVGGFLESHGQSGYTQKIYHSVQALFAAKHGSADSGTDKPDGLYSLQELDETAVSISAYQSIIDSVYKNGGNKMPLSARLAKADMSMEQIALQIGSSGLLDALRKARPSIHHALAADRQSFLDRSRQEGSLNARG